LFRFDESKKAATRTIARAAIRPDELVRPHDVKLD